MKPPLFHQNHWMPISHPSLTTSALTWTCSMRVKLCHMDEQEIENSHSNDPVNFTLQFLYLAFQLD